MLACYDSALAITPELAGKATVVFVVAADAADAVDGGPVRGHVISGEVSDSTMASPFFEARVLKEIVNLPFDAPAGGGSVTVSYPFVFALDDDNDDDDDTQAP